MQSFQDSKQNIKNLLKVLIRIELFSYQYFKLTYDVKQNFIQQIMGCTQSGIDDASKPTPPLLTFEESDTTNKQGEQALTGLLKSMKNISPSERKQEKKPSKLSVFDQNQLEQLYNKAGKNNKLFFQATSERTSEFYLSLSNEVLEMMNEQKLNTNQSKILISERVLIMSLDILEFIGQKTKYTFDLKTFETFDRTQKTLINYLQMKYPRGGKAFVPGDLMDKFKNFNMVESPENDILRNAKICFNDSSTIEIINKIKLLFNKLLDELDTNYPIFQKFLHEKIFKIPDQNGNNKLLPYKIGRKIPQTVSKYIIDDSQDLTIKSPEIFRVIIKWVDDIQSYLKHPEEQINEKQSFKMVSDIKNLTYDDIDPDDMEGLGSSLKQNLREIEEQYKKQIAGLKNQMNVFNLNLIKILSYSERIQKFVPKHDAIVIKYAMFNTKLVSWMLTQKLIFVLKNLIEVGKKVQNSMMGQIDLVKFNLTDLMRSMVKGSKKQILAVYKNIKQREENGDLKIVKIKNRLGTPLNDVMIIFTIKQSYLICQLQLILTEANTKSEKLKNIQFLNHFLYELQRTPYGVLSELAVVLGFKDNKVNYEDFISFEDMEVNIGHCENNHPASVTSHEIQKKPFICTHCTEFYNPFENIFTYKICTKCHIFQCCRCIFKNHKELEKIEVEKAFHGALWHQTFSNINKKTLPKQFQQKTFLDVFNPQKVFLRDHFINWQVKPKDFEKFIQEGKILPPQIGVSFHFMLVQFKGDKVNLKVLYWDYDRKQIRNSYFPDENFYSYDSVTHSYYDFIVFFQEKKNVEIQSDKCQKCTKLYFSSKEMLTNKRNKTKKYQVLLAYTGKKPQDTIYIILTDHAPIAQIEGIDADEYQLNMKRTFKFKNLSEALSQFPEVKITKQNLQMKNFGLTTKLLEFFKQCPWKQKIKILNISNNLITDISAIIPNLPNLQSLFVSKNFLSEIDISKQHKNLSKFICSGNKIKKLKGIEKLTSLKHLNINANLLESFPAIKSLYLKQLSANDNAFKSFEGFYKSQLPSLENLFLISSLYQVNDKKIIIKQKKIKKIILSNNNIQNLQIQGEQLQYLDCQSSFIKSLKLKTNNLKYLDFQSNQLTNLNQVLKNQFPKLEKINGYYGSDSSFIFDLPQINSYQLMQINFTQCSLKDISALTLCNFPILKNLILQSIQCESIPEMNFPNLNKLEIGSSQLKQIQLLGKSNLSKLNILKISGAIANVIKTFPSLNFDELQNLSLNSLTFKQIGNLGKSFLPHLQEFTFSQVYSEIFPRLQFPKLKILSLSLCQFKNVKPFQKSNLKSLNELIVSNLNEDLDKQSNQDALVTQLSLSSLKKLDSSGNWALLENILQNIPQIQEINIYMGKLKYFPKFNSPKLTKICLNSTQTTDLSLLATSNIPIIQQLTINSCSQLTKLPKLNFSSLKTLNLSYNAIQDITQFQKSTLPILQTLQLTANSIKQFPALKLPKLKTFSISQNNFSSLDGLNLSNLSDLQTLDLSDCTELANKTFPVIQFNYLKNLSFYNCNINNIDNLSKSKLPKLQTLTINQCPIKKLPVLNLGSLREISIYHRRQYLQPVTNENTNLNNEVNAENLQQNQLNGDYTNKYPFDISNLTQWNCPNLQTINFSQFQIPSFPAYFKLPKLNSLNLSSIKILKQQSEISLKQCVVPQLQYLYLTEMNLKKAIHIPDYIQYYSIYVSQITDLDNISQIKAQTISITNCQKLTKVSKLYLQDTISLDLSLNKISGIDNFIKQAPKLQQLYLSNNQIANFPVMRLPSLQTLDLSSNKLSKIQLKALNYPELHSITLSYNKGNSNKEEQQNQNKTGLEIIQIDCPKLTSFYAVQCNLKQINFFKQHPQQLKYYKADSYIQLSSNQIQTIKYIPPCSNLNVQRNKLTNLTFLKQLQSYGSNLTLTISNNKLSDLKQLKNIQKKLIGLYICDNQKEVQFNFNQFDMPILSTLHINNSQVTKITAIQSSKYPQLSQLQITGNKIQKIPTIQLPQLSYLYLQQNQIKTIQPLKLKKLSYLLLNDNKLESLNWLSKSQLPKLYDLNVRSNQISKIPALNLLEELYSLNIANNPIIDVEGLCNCKYRKLEYITYSMEKINSKQLKNNISEKIMKKFPSSYKEYQQGQEEQNALEGVEGQVGGNQDNAIDVQDFQGEQNNQNVDNAQQNNIQNQQPKQG